MRKKVVSIVLTAAMLATSVHLAAFAMPSNEVEEWTGMPEVFEVNREPAKADSVAYQDLESALTKDKNQSCYYQLLNGTWKFKWVSRPAERDNAFFAKEYDVSSWDDIEVPRNWQTVRKEDGRTFKYDKPIYVNNIYPWTGTVGNGNPGGTATIEGFAPTQFNPVGHYRRDFEVPEDWDGREVFVSFQGVESAFYLYVNGHEVGYSEDSYTPSDFNITDYLIPGGTNTIALQVFRWSDGSYLEDQDMIRLSGIFRDVYLYSKDKVELFDYKIETDLDENYEDATLDVNVDVRNLDLEDPGKYTVEAQLYDAEQQKVLESPLVTEIDFAGENVKTDKMDCEVVSGSMSATVEDPLKWSAEKPNLYTTVLTLKDENGEVVEMTSARTGFRELEFASSGAFMVNGKQVKLRGVNRHETSPEYGRTVSYDLMKKDIELMKQYNINTVRTSHYPNCNEWYDLCDEYGIYVVDEANMESQGLDSVLPSNNDTWRPACVDRVVNMVERDKNHPSIIFWSMANESGSGDVFTSMVNAAKAIDDTRFTHYEKDDSRMDMDSVMYPSVSAVESRGKSGNTRPFFVCEYGHAMGNSFGNLKEFWEVFNKYDNLMGGCIWDWVDQTIYTPIPDGEGMYPAFGGDWGDDPNNNNFCVNGIINADRTVKAVTSEVKKAYQAVLFDEVDLMKGQIEIRNTNIDTNVNEYNLNWELKENDTVIASGTLTDEEADIAPLEKKTVTLPYEIPETKPGAEYWVNVTTTLKNDSKYAQKGHVVDEEQFTVTFGEKEPEKYDKADMPEFESVEETDTEIKVAGENFNLAIDKTTGRISSYEADGKTLLEKGPKGNYWRARIDNDLNVDDRWKTVSQWDYEPRIYNLECVQGEKAMIVKVEYIFEGAANSRSTVSYTIYPSGDVVVKNSMDVGNGMNQLARYGMRMELPAEYSNVQYYGRGPQESYWDRKYAADIGVYKNTVEGMYQPYIKSQDCGNRTDTRWVTLTNDEGTGLMVSKVGEVPFEFSALNYTQEDISSVLHPYEVQKSENITLTVDFHQMGLGIGLGPDKLPEYTLYGSGRSYTQTFRLTPITAGYPVMEESQKELYAQEEKIPGTIEAEDYFAMSGIETEECFDEGAGLNVTAIDKNDSLDYRVNVSDTGMYKLKYRTMADEGVTADFDVMVDGKLNNYAEFESQGNEWQDYEQMVSLTKGSHVIRVVARSGGWKLNRMEFTYAGQEVPCRIEAEDYLQKDGTVREDGPGLGYIGEGDWMEYTVSVPKAGKYYIYYGVASTSDSAGVEFLANGESLARTTFPNTGGWQNWDTFVQSVEFSEAGQYTIRLNALSDGWNIDYFEITDTNLKAVIEGENYVNESGTQVQDSWLAYIDDGDWMEYDITIEKPGTYQVAYNVGVNKGVGKVGFEVNGETLATTELPATGGWQDWQTYTDVVEFAETGEYTIRLNAVTGGWNLDYFSVRPYTAPADKSELQACYEQYVGMEQGNYTDESWANFEDALENARNILVDSKALQADADAAVKVLKNAVDGLAEEGQIVDKTELQTMIMYAQEQQKLPQYQYVVPVAKEVFEKALADAIAVNDNEQATQGQVDRAYSELVDKLQLLSMTGNSEELKALVETVDKMDLTIYTDITRKALEDALAEAKEVLANENSLQNIIDAAKDALEDALDALVMKPVDQSKLKKLSDSADRYTDRLHDFTDTTAGNFTAALEHARKILEKEDPTQKETDEAYVNLRNAIFGLREVPSKDKLENLKK
ncbi:glycoside hydrolase family 2 TIM barrel-domain containing protein [Lachnoclostridium sp. An181]|uniref:glycoside hydrolase family 2 TIM barrel-domain containing protein n=1 Tax=Lachnoclostridium sp. An181 TaxID=1965575 RepID=UPI000B36E7D2|nr:glycoside hydrolase family 2 TIM barrel-domain containing protein [Lachnoclostridium sp. An181]OUP48619.1 hypothetical protein B5F18_11495 [Lachnoclostridium sp. An181]